MDKWHIGEPVDWGDGYMDPINWGRRYDDNENKHNNDKINPTYFKRDEYSEKAWDYFMDNKLDKALYYINLALDLDRGHANNWNKKAIVLEYMERYAESERCYNKSLELYHHSLVCDNKARMLRDWAASLIRESEELPNGLAKMEEALEKNRKAIDSLPGDESEENIDRFISQKRSIESHIKYEKEYHKNVESLKAYDKSELFTIAGRKFYKTNIRLTPGMSLKLVKEPDNQFDQDAIAVYAKDNKIGYVANNKHTTFELTSSASELQGKIGNTAQAEYLVYLYRPTNVLVPDIQIYIGKIIK